MVIEQKFKPGEEPDPTEFLFVSMEMKRQDQSKPYDAKKACWVPDEKEGFVQGLIQGTKGDLTIVSIDGSVIDPTTQTKVVACISMANLCSDFRTRRSRRTWLPK